MPIINGRYYMNAQYGLGLERARAADEEERRLHGEPKPSWLDHFLGVVTDSETEQQGKSRGTIHGQRTEDNRERVAVPRIEHTSGESAGFRARIAQLKRNPGDLLKPPRAHASGADVLVTYSDGRQEVRMGGSRSWRNNNPGNIRPGTVCRKAGSHR